MVATFYNSYLKLIRDKLKDVIAARKTTDGLTVAEIRAGVHGSFDRFAPTGVYVLGAGYDPKGDRGGSSRSIESVFHFNVLVQVRNWKEADMLDKLGQLVGLIADAIEANPTLDGVGNTGQAWIESVAAPDVVEGGQFAFQVVTVGVDASRAPAT